MVESVKKSPKKTTSKLKWLGDLSFLFQPPPSFRFQTFENKEMTRGCAPERFLLAARQDGLALRSLYMELFNPYK